MSEPTGRIKAADFERSDRLKQTVDVLIDGQWHTTLELRDRTNSCAVHTDLAELRANLFVLERRYHGKINGRRVYAYRLVGRRAA